MCHGACNFAGLPPKSPPVSRCQTNRPCSTFYSNRSTKRTQTIVQGFADATIHSRNLYLLAASLASFRAKQLSLKVTCVLSYKFLWPLFIRDTCRCPIRTPLKQDA